jgi:hypothetical protein
MPRQLLSLSEQGFEKPTSRVCRSGGKDLLAAPTMTGKWQLKAGDWFPRATNTIEYAR